MLQLGCFSVGTSLFMGRGFFFLSFFFFVDRSSLDVGQAGGAVDLYKCNAIALVFSLPCCHAIRTCAINRSCYHGRGESGGGGGGEVSGKKYSIY